MSKELRVRILLLLEQHARTDSSQYVDDRQLARELDVPVVEIRRQMDMLESQGLIRAANSLDGNSAVISAEGSLVVEDLMESTVAPEKRAIGFRSTTDDD